MSRFANDHQGMLGVCLRPCGPAPLCLGISYLHRDTSLIFSDPIGIGAGALTPPGTSGAVKPQPPYVGRVGPVEGGWGIGSARTPCQNVKCITAPDPQNQFLFHGPPVEININ